jgi:DNA repair exonuclease SbcCD ATPase subunit
MNTEIVKLNPKEFGLEEKQVQTIEAAFMPKIVERDGLKTIYSELITKEITPELCKEAKNLRLKLVKVRTGIAEIHKVQKAFYLAAGRYVDAWKNKETLPVEQMEEKLCELEEYYERIEAARIATLQQERSAELSKYQDETAFIPGNLGELTDEVWSNYLLGVKTACEQKKAAQKAAEEAEVARIEAEKAEQERIRQENERLEKALKAQKAKAEAEAKKAAEKLKAEQAKAAEEARKAAAEKAKLEAELKAKAEAEAKAKAEAEALKEAELSKGDADKVKDLIAYLSAGKTKFQFKSKKNQKLYAGVGGYLDKLIGYIQKGGVA